MAVWKFPAASALAIATGLGFLSLAHGQAPDIQIVGLDCNADPEVVVIENVGEAAVDLTGWQLLSAPPESQVFDLFTVGALEPGGRLFIESGTSAGGLHVWATEFVFRDGDPTDYARIVDDSGAVVHEVNCVAAEALPPVVDVPNGGGPPPVGSSSPVWTVLLGAAAAIAGIVMLAMARRPVSWPSDAGHAGPPQPGRPAARHSRGAASYSSGRSRLLVAVALLGLGVLLSGALLSLGSLRRRE